MTAIRIITWPSHSALKGLHSKPLIWQQSWRTGNARVARITLITAILCRHLLSAVIVRNTRISWFPEFAFQVVSQNFVTNKAPPLTAKFAMGDQTSFSHSLEVIRGQFEMSWKLQRDMHVCFRLVTASNLKWAAFGIGKHRGCGASQHASELVCV